MLQTKDNLSISSHVRCRYISMSSNKIMNLLSKDTSETFQLAHTQVLWGAPNATLCTTIGNVDYGGLPCHQLSQGIYLIRIHL